MTQSQRRRKSKRCRQYQIAKNERGLCSFCSNPLAPHSKTKCQHHLDQEKQRYWKFKDHKQGSREEIRAMWASMDWSLSAQEIAKITQRTVPTVYNVKRKMRKAKQ